MKDPSTAIAI